MVGGKVFANKTIEVFANKTIEAWSLETGGYY
jgi:hypothetical protein